MNLKHMFQSKNLINQYQSQSTSGFLAINLACGDKLCQQPGWVNADHKPSAKDVLKINLQKSLPFEDNTFNVVYHSQFIEHLPMNKAHHFLNECYRILKPNGILRIVTPDLENQATEYLRNLQMILHSPCVEEVRLRYEWIRLEMLDQLTRHTSGGDMLGFLASSGENIRNYICQRLGRSGENLIPAPRNSTRMKTSKHIVRVIKKNLIEKLNKMVPDPLRVGTFRLSGEAHLCMYDKYLLSMILSECSFENIEHVSAMESRIPNWDITLLDCDSLGNPDDPASLFMEAVKLKP